MLNSGSCPAGTGLMQSPDAVTPDDAHAVPDTRQTDFPRCLIPENCLRGGDKET
ncbi:hypothetical protein MJ561_00560 [Klebsiella pneumoniae]|nr:hypothetical protein MJ561_00560 [Klebsiella pneumoniae]